MNAPGKFVLCVALLSATALFLHSRTRSELVPSSTPLAKFPQEFAGWTGSDIPISDDVLQVLGPGDFLSRIYHRDIFTPPIDFFIAYFPSQRTGDTMHSPKNCLPGAGWSFSDTRRIQLPSSGSLRSPLIVNRYVIAKGSDRRLVLYWYQAHGRAEASEYWAKFYLVSDSMRMNRSDGALVRIITQIASGETAESAELRAIQFADSVVPQLPRFIPN